ncbi:MAG: hypothetical protein U1F68_03265 [Gammaproteobacteria bacterium]
MALCIDPRRCADELVEACLTARLQFGPVEIEVGVRRQADRYLLSFVTGAPHFSSGEPPAASTHSPCESRTGPPKAPHWTYSFSWATTAEAEINSVKQLQPS